MKHRGPDGRGIALFNSHSDSVSDAYSSLALGHLRLSIIDLTSGGDQPMSTADGRYTIVYNGEIYNYLELKSELSTIGYIFRTSSDTEVLLAAWSHWGQDALSRCSGMFAFALYDNLERTVSLVRDPFGIKPLYIACWKNGVAAASEPAPLFELPGVSKKLRPQAVYEYLVRGRDEFEEKTFFRDIEQVGQGECWTFHMKDGRVEKMRYWAPSILSRPIGISFERAVSETRERFLHNVQIHLRSDVPIGFCLSGGIDSSSIVCAARAVSPRAEIHAFSFDAEDEKLSEYHWAELVGSHVNAKLTRVVGEPAELCEELVTMMRYQGSPVASASIYAQFRVFQAAKRAGLKVMLDGQGADEMLAGYEPYLSAVFFERLARADVVSIFNGLFSESDANRSYLRRRALPHAFEAVLPFNLGGILRRYLVTPPFPSWLRREWFLDRGIEVRSGVDMYSERRNLRRALAKSLGGDQLGHLLRYEDRNSMAHSLESRVPFLTKDFADWMLSLRSEYVVDRRWQRKAVFREAMRGIVPDAILERQDKLGFAAPELRWLRGAADWISLILRRGQGIPCLNIPALQQELVGLANGNSQVTGPLWRALNLLVGVEIGLFSIERG